MLRKEGLVFAALDATTLGGQHLQGHRCGVFTLSLADWGQGPHKLDLHLDPFCALRSLSGRPDVHIGLALL